MFSYLTGPQFLLVIAGVIALYYGVIALYYRRRPEQPALYPQPQMVQTVQGAVRATPLDLIGSPAPDWEEELEMFLEPDPEGYHSIEMLEDDDSILLKEAERVVEEIQVAINHVASNPPNPEEVFTKIRAIVRQYRIFQNTVYFEAVNGFIAQAVQRDCDIKWSEQDLLVLWN